MCGDNCILYNYVLKNYYEIFGGYPAGICLSKKVFQNLSKNNALKGEKQMEMRKILVVLGLLCKIKLDIIQKVIF